MYLNGQMIFHHILRHGKVFEGCIRRASTVCVDDKVSLAVVPPRLPDHIHKILGEGVDSFITVGVRLVPIGLQVEYFVITFKQQFRIILLKPVGYLLPQLAEFVLRSQIGVPIGPYPAISTGIMMHIDDAIHVFVEDILHHLFHTIHPLLAHIAALVHVL